MGMFWTEGKTRLCFSPEGKPETPELVLSEDERNGVEAVLTALESGGIDPASFHLERTKEYLKLSAMVEHDGVNIPREFCRLKLVGRSLFISLPISSKDAKALSEDPRFSGLTLGKKRFSNIPIADPADIEELADVVFLGYRWGVTVA